MVGHLSVIRVILALNEVVGLGIDDQLKAAGAAYADTWN